MRLGSKTDDEFLIKLNNKNNQIQNMAKPNQILIGSDVSKRLHPNSQKEFQEIIWKNDEWKYRSRLTGNIYQVYEYKG